MTTKIDIILNGVKLEAEIDGEPPEPSNSYPGSFEICALRIEEGRDIWPIIGEIDGVEELIIAAIEREKAKGEEG